MSQSAIFNKLLGNKITGPWACFDVCKKNILNIIFTHWAVEKKNSACTLDTAQLCSSFIVVYQIFVKHKNTKNKDKVLFFYQIIYIDTTCPPCTESQIYRGRKYIYIFICVAVTLNKIVIQVFHINVKRNSTFFTKLREIHTIKNQQHHILMRRHMQTQPSAHLADKFWNGWIFVPSWGGGRTLSTLTTQFYHILASSSLDFSVEDRAYNKHADT